MSKIAFFWKESWLLVVSSCLFGLILAVAQAGLNPIIKHNEQEKLSHLMGSLITDANHFEIAAQAIPIKSPKGKILKTDVYKGLDAQGRTRGFAFIAEGPGFADKIKLVIAVDQHFKTFYGFKVLSSNETPGFGDKIKNDYYSQQYVGAPAGPLTLVKVGDDKAIDSTIVAISGATISSTAVLNIFNTYVETIKTQLQSKGLIP